MLTPIDIQNHNLKTGVRGYSKKETDDFLEEVLASYEEIYRENHELKEKLSSLSEGIQYYKNMENTLQKALVLAEKTSTETQEAAKSAADAMLKEAKAKAEAIQKEADAYAEVAKSNANRELESTRDHVRKLVQSYENYRLQFKKLAESQIEMLNSETYSIFAPELQEMLENAPSADEAMSAEKTVGIQLEENPFGTDPMELTEEEKLAETKDLSGILKDAKKETELSDATGETQPESIETVDEGEQEGGAEEEPVKEENEKNPEAAETTHGETVEETTGEETLQEEEETKKTSHLPENTEIAKSVSPEKKEEEESPFMFIDTE